MQIIRLPVEMAAWSQKTVIKGHSIALVPTMGCFHEGHLRLMRMAKSTADCVVVSLFVNPVQFGPQEDFSEYPRNFNHDTALAQKEKVDVLFLPEAAAMYPEQGICTKVIVAELTSGLCGAKRPGHFEGVTTVVAKLFNIVRPHKAVFGLKDFQQLAVIKQMVYDLNWPITILAHPVVREDDGLAMSSRNIYLSPAERAYALCLFKSITHARHRVHEDGFNDAALLLAEVRQIIGIHDDVVIEYISLVDRNRLVVQKKIDIDSVLALAVKVGSTRLIDNDMLFAENKGVP